MEKQKDELYLRVDYVKPVILDLGAVNMASGGGPCDTAGGSATTDCVGGTGAADFCASYGTEDALAGCRTGSFASQT